MRKGWETKTLGEVCVVERGSSPRPIAEFITTSEDGVNWIKIGDTENGGKYVTETKQKITHAGASQSRRVYPNDFILTNSMSFGRPYIMKIEGCIHDGWFALRLGSNINVDYFYHLLSSNYVQNQFKDLAAGSVVKNISGDLVKKAILPIPPIDEQKQIVEILDKAFADLEIVRANAEANLKNARELYESYLEGIFSISGNGWTVKTLSEVCAKITDGTHQTPKYFSKGVIFLSSKNVTSGKIDWDNVKYIDEAQHIDMQKRVSPRKGDILLAKNGTTGVAAKVDRDEIFDIYVSLAHLRPLEEITSDYLLHFINSPVAKKQFNKRLKGMGVPNLHLEEIREVKIPLPPSIISQDIISREIDAMKAETDRLLAIYTDKIFAIDELKQSLLAKAFAGELLKDDNVIQLNVSANANTKAPEFTANIIAYAHLKHKMAMRDLSFKRVKAQKFLHLVESIAGIDLGRCPQKVQYGPHDENHMNNVQEFAKEVLFFEFVQQGAGYDFAERLKYNQLIAEARKAIEPYKTQIDKILEIIIPMDSRQAEVFATVHASWNNLLLDGKQPNNDEIIYEARENWHPKKLDIPKSEFEIAIKLIKSHGVEPKGEGKRVIGQERLI